MTEPDEQPNTRHGCLILWLLIAVVVGGIIAVVKLWPDSLKERQDAAVETCETAVDAYAPTPLRKMWEESTISITDDEPFTVAGEFWTKRDPGNRQFTCTVDGGKVTHVTVHP